MAKPVTPPRVLPLAWDIKQVTQASPVAAAPLTEQTFREIEDYEVAAPTGVPSPGVVRAICRTTPTARRMWGRKCGDAGTDRHRPVRQVNAERSPLGFVNIPMDRLGVQRPALKALARTSVLPGQKPAAASGARDITPHSWLGAGVRNVADMGEMSALGLPGVTGVLVLEVPADSVLAKGGLQKGDVILCVNGSKTVDVGALLQQAPALADVQSLALVVSRQQKEVTLNIKR